MYLFQQEQQPACGKGYHPLYIYIETREKKMNE